MGTSANIVVVNNKKIYTKRTMYDGYIGETGLRFMNYVEYLGNHKISIEDFLWSIVSDGDSQIIIENNINDCYKYSYTYIFDIDNEEIIVFYGNKIIYQEEWIYATYENLEKCKK